MDGISPRSLAPNLEDALATAPVVVVTGARQTGKSTLVQQLPSAAARHYETLDDLDVLAVAERDPDALLARGAAVTLDEVQRAPALLHAIKRAVDRDRRKGRFLLTGSANLLLMSGVAESLAGRAVYLSLGPMTIAERSGVADPGPWSELLAAEDVAQAERALRGRGERRIAWREEVALGGFPPAALEPNPTARARWFDGYVTTYVERDLRQLAEIDRLVDFRRLVRIAATRVGSLLNQSELARAAGLTQPTAHRYLNLLETSFLIHRIAPYAVNRGKRLTRTPKLYFGDTGLAAFLAGWSGDGTTPADEVLGGGLLENLLLIQLLAWRETQTPRPDLLHWRTTSGAEVDFLLETTHRLLPIEVKAAGRAGPSDARGLATFLADHPRRARYGLLIHTGTDLRPIAPNILAAPLARLV